jgi:hypothetical protein
MKVMLDNKEILDISDTMIKVIGNDIAGDVVGDIERRLAWVIIHKYEQCFARLKAEWDPKLATRNIEMIPTNKEKYAELVFSQSDYKSRTERDNNVSSN